jgi:FecR protein
MRMGFEGSIAMKNNVAGSLMSKGRFAGFGCIALLLVGVGLASGCALSAAALPFLPANDNANEAASKVPAARAVRLSFVEGPVRVVQDGQVIADPAYANLPLFEGAQVIAGDEGRAEVQLEDGSVARLSPNSTITFSVLQQQGSGTRTEIVVNGGLAYFELQPSNAQNSVRVNYGSTSFEASSFSVVRVIADQLPGELAVFSGNVHLEHGGTQLDVHGGESLNLNSKDGAGYNIAESIEPDSWDSWNADRDQMLNSVAADKTAASASFVNSQGSGISDLDANGNWYNVPGEGYVWSPYEAQLQGSAWDPYGYGNWTYYPNYGYLFVSGYGWGYAPYSCGMWNYYSAFGWGWSGGGGCSPWWNGSGAGWYGGYGGAYGLYNIGRYPHGYQPPRRPVPGPIHPMPGGEPRQPSTIHRVAMPSIPVDRRQPISASAAQSFRPLQSVTIGGHTVEPMRPLAPPRPGYDRSVGYVGAGNQGRSPVYGVPNAGAHTGYVPQPSRPVQPVYQPSYRSSGGGYAPPSRPASPSGGGGGIAGGGGHSVSMPSSGGGGASHGGGSAPSPHK